MSGTRAYDVIVCGGGPAGIGAAVASARTGARTLLIEQMAHLGGMGTSANLWCMCDSPGGPVYDEVIRRLERIGASHWETKPGKFHAPGRARYHRESLKVVAADLVAESGADILFCTVADSARVEAGQARGVWAANKSGRAEIHAEVVIDATADGDIAARAGAEFQQGDPEDGRIQHVNYCTFIEEVDAERANREALPPDRLAAMLRQSVREGRIRPPANVFRPSAEAFPFDVATGRLQLGYWEIEKTDPTDAWAVSRTLAECQRAALDVLRFCREHLPGYEHCRLGPLPALLGTRESRRIIGRATLTRDDVVNAVKSPDAVARGAFWIDFHDSPPGTTLPYPDDYVRATRPAEGDWYDIPYGCLLPREIGGLLVAGRCISADRSAQASLRIMPTCFHIGAAAGAAAALAAREGTAPDKLDPERVRECVGRLG